MIWGHDHMIWGHGHMIWEHGHMIWGAWSHDLGAWSHDLGSMVNCSISNIHPCTPFWFDRFAVCVLQALKLL